MSDTTFQTDLQLFWFTEPKINSHSMKNKTFHVSKSIFLVDEIKTSFVVTHYFNLLGNT